MAPPLSEDSSAPEIEITDAFLRESPLPQPDPRADKEVRGRLLVVGGSAEMPGTVILAATAALRAGAGKVRIATCSTIAPLVASQMLEGRVFALPETAAGGIAPDAAELVLERARESDALLIGPGMIDEQGVAGLLDRLLPALEDLPLILDAGALSALNKARAAISSPRRKTIMTPHATEMASLLGCKPEDVSRDTRSAAKAAAERFKVNVLLKGAETLLALPSGKLYRHGGGNVGLATGGSGDTLAGLMGGLMARGASIEQAAAWAVYVHARAGVRLAGRIGPLGFLAREIAAEFPAVIRELEDTYA